MGDELLTLLGAVVTVLLVMALAYGCTRLLAGRLPGTVTGSGQRIRILERVSMGKDSHLLLVKLGDTYQFLGVSQGTVTCLRQVPPEEAEHWDQTGEDTRTPGFQAALRQVLEQRKNKGGQ
ncbi:FliO/MopB family protein [Candidatus Avoscillospira sp. LCP25S3_F1]|uniref:FliO/MopB family protein n=1 Tax=Candidatus Avoscillospira sp. LCP25S3_F1 TaxID=3438825 RepID=UPI003F93718A